MKILRNSLLILLSLTLIFTLPFLLFGQAIKETILKPYDSITYIEKSEIAIDIERHIKQSLREDIKESENDPGRKLVLIIMGKVVDEVVTSTWVFEKLDQIQSSTWDYILDKKSTVEQIPITDFYESFNAIAEKQIDEFAKEHDIPSYLIKKELIKGIAKNIPNTLKFIKTYEDSIKRIEKLKFYYEKLNTYLYYLGIIVSFTFLLGILVANSRTRILKWVGINFIISGLVTIFLSLLGYIINKQIVLKNISFTGSMLHFKESIIKLLDLMLGDVTGNTLIYSTSIFILGIILIVIRLRLIKSS